MALEISRRSFLKGMAVTGAAAALAPMSITSAPAEEAKSYLPQEKYDISKVMDFDVVVVGAGGGGVSNPTPKGGGLQDLRFQRSLAYGLTSGLDYFHSRIPVFAGASLH